MIIFKDIVTYLIAHQSLRDRLTRTVLNPQSYLYNVLNVDNILLQQDTVLFVVFFKYIALGIGEWRPQYNMKEQIESHDDATIFFIYWFHLEVPDIKAVKL